MVISALGLLVLLYRLGPAIFKRAKTREARDAKISVIIPARNEEANLPKLLKSLLRLRPFEIIVIDDSSEDRTKEVAQSFEGVRVVEGSQRPQGWTGKNWACQQGALIATGDYLLFTDADTEHLDHAKALALDADLVSAVPYHQNNTFLEKCLGPFHMLVFISSSAFAKPRRKSLFAIGQFLLFKRDWYFKQGMHEAIKESFADDLDLAERCLATGGHYRLETSGETFKVRMYPDFTQFIQGWKRIFRVGFQHASIMRVVEIFLVIACLTESFKFMAASPQETWMALAGIVVLALAQRRYGNFSWLGAVLAPLGIGTFVYVSGAAMYDRIRRRDLRWRGRSYKLSS